MTVNKLVSISDKIKFYEKVFGKGDLARNGKNFAVRCPICAPQRRDKLKLVIYVENDMNHCWTCGWGARTLAPLLAKHSTRELLREYVSTFLDQQNDKFYSILEEEHSRVALPSDFILLPLASDYDPDFRACKNYIESRNLTLADAWHHMIGVSKEPRWRRRVIFPSFDKSGDLNYFVARAVDNKKFPRYDTPPVPPGYRNTFIFNEHRIDWKQRVVLCEGVFDLAKCPENSVPLLGSELNEKSLLLNMLVANETPVTLLLDADTAEEKMPKIVNKLNQYAIDVSVADITLAGSDDAGETSKQAVVEVVSKAKQLGWQDMFLSKIHRVTSTRSTL